MPGSTARRPYRDRREAGRVLAARLDAFRDRDDVVVLGLPRGGVPVAAQVAAALGAPLDVFVVRKLGVPGHRELAMGAIASGGVRVLNDDVVRSLAIPPPALEAVARAEAEELRRREGAYRDGRAPVPVTGRTVLLVDDGLATGASMRAAVIAVRALDPAEVVVAVPTASATACEALREVADDVVCVSTPAPFRSVGDSYADFDQTGDDEVRDLLRRAAGPPGGTRTPPGVLPPPGGPGGGRRPG